MSQAKRHYDFAILGGGGAGLSLLCHLHWAGALANRSLLIVEPDNKNRHDRTWSFWEQTDGPFEHVVAHRWSSIGVHNDKKQDAYNLGKYVYKLIKSTDFYAFCHDLIASLPNVVVLKAKAENIHLLKEQTEIAATADRKVAFYAAGQTYTAKWAFSSLPQPVRHDAIEQPYLDQHFRGWFIRTKTPSFDPKHATLMDFRTEQAGETRFFYVLPFSTTEAMVEIAIFSNNHLSADAYDQAIKTYLAKHWDLASQDEYEVYHTEQGVIPMTTYPYERQKGHLIYIGLSGGYARPSTGYTFYNMQRQLSALAKRFAKQKEAVKAKRPWPQRHMHYDGTLLDILMNGKLSGSDLFPELFSRNPTSRVLAFLNGETSLLSELQLMSTTQIGPFARAFLRQLRF